MLLSRHNTVVIFYQMLKYYYTLLGTLSVSTATAEWLFSTLGKLNNYLRSAMVEWRLNGFSS